MLRARKPVANRSSVSFIMLLHVVTVAVDTVERTHVPKAPVVRVVSKESRREARTTVSSVVVSDDHLVVTSVGDEALVEPLADHVVRTRSSITAVRAVSSNHRVRLRRTVERLELMDNGHVVHAILVIVVIRATLLAASQTVRHSTVSNSHLRRPVVISPCRTQRSPRALLKSCVCVCVVPG